MNSFTIKDIENLSGIKAHTLRIWEQRYKMFVPKRKASRHRIYDCEDLKQLLTISFLYKKGMKISKIAELSNTEIQSLIKEFSDQKNNYEASIIQLLESSIDFDKEKFEKTVNSLIVQMGLEKSIKEVFFPFLHRIGLLWMTNHVIPAQEHFVSHIIRKKIILATDGIDMNQHDKNNILVFAPDHEFHEIPLLAINYFLRKYNNRTTYFGVNVSTDCINYYMETHSVDCLYVHMITHLTNCNIESYFKNLTMKYPHKKIIVSGPIIKCIHQKTNNLLLLQSMDEMIDFAKKRGQKV